MEELKILETRRQFRSGQDARNIMDISVVICTKDRCELLQRAIELLAAQNLPRDKTFEIIIVDNNSSDATAQVVRTQQTRSSRPLHYFFEGKSGLSNARNRGIKESSGDIIVFTDDDMIFSDNWLGGIYAAFLSPPAPACVVGPVSIHEDSHPALNSSFPPGRKRFIFPSEPWDAGRGNNMAFKRKTLLEAGPFDTRLGAGTRAGSGEDIDMFYRILKNGGDILFDPGIEVFHDHGRHDAESIERICRNYAIGGTAFLIKYIIRMDLFALKLLFWKYESFRLAWKRSKKDTRFNPPVNKVKKIYMRGYFSGIARGIADLFKQ